MAIFCPVCSSDQIQIGDCDVFNGYFSFGTYQGKEYEADCLSCRANGEGLTIEAAVSNMKPTLNHAKLRSIKFATTRLARVFYLENPMPTVGKKKFPYTVKGAKQAKSYAKKTSQKVKKKK